MTLEIRFDPASKKFTFSMDSTLSVRPPKFSLDDKYADYRRKELEAERRSKGLLS